MRLTYQTRGGEHIVRAAAAAIELATSKQAELNDEAVTRHIDPELVTVEFTFNEVNIVVNARSNSDEVAEFFGDEMDRKHEAYKKSAEGIAAAKRDEDELVATKIVVNDLLSKLPLCDTLKELMEWLVLFAAAADRVGVDSRMPFVVAELKRRGITRNMWVGDAEVKTGRHKQKSAEYILGQVLDMAEGGMPPHPMCGEFAKRWLTQDGDLSYREVPLPPK